MAPRTPSLFGKRGQRQHGIDILGELCDPTGTPVGTAVGQAHNSESFDWQKLTKDVATADRALPLTPAIFTFASAASRDARVQERVEALNEVRRAEGKYMISVVFWEDFCDVIASRPKLLAAYYPNINQTKPQTRAQGISPFWVVAGVLGTAYVVNRGWERTLDEILEEDEE